MHPDFHLQYSAQHSKELRQAADKHRLARDARKTARIYHRPHRDLHGDLRERLGWALVSLGLRLAVSPE